MSQLKFLLLSLFIFLLTTSAVRGQQVTGQVRYADTGQAAFNVPVHCNGTGTNQIQQTDRSGKFVCTLGSPGSFTITIKAPGYLDESQSGNALDTTSREYMFFRLKPDPRGQAAAAKTVVVNANVPQEARKEFELGEAATARGERKNLEEGIRHFEKAVGLYPGFAQAQMRLGAAYMDLQQWEKAEQAFKKTLEIDPKAFQAFFALGEVYARQKRNDEAEKVLLQGLAIEDRSFQGHFILGRLYWDMALKFKDEAQYRPLLEKAYEQTKKALELNPNLAEAHLLKGNLLFKVRRAPDALREFEEYLRLEPKGQFAEATRAMVDKIKKALEATKKG